MTSRITVINKHDHKPLQPNTLRVYIGRPNAKEPGACMGNPFEIGKDGDRNEVIAKYRDWLPHQGGLIVTTLNNIRDYMKQGFDVELECYCAPRACHGDVIKERLQPTIRVMTAVALEPKKCSPATCPYRPSHRFVPDTLHKPHNTWACEACDTPGDPVKYEEYDAKLQRELMIDFIMDDYRDCSADDREDWARATLEWMTKEQLGNLCAELAEA